MTDEKEMTRVEGLELLKNIGTRLDMVFGKRNLHSTLFTDEQLNRLLTLLNDKQQRLEQAKAEVKAAFRAARLVRTPFGDDELIASTNVEFVYKHFADYTTKKEQSK